MDPPGFRFSPVAFLGMGRRGWEGLEPATSQHPLCLTQPCKERLWLKRKLLTDGMSGDRIRVTQAGSESTEWPPEKGVTVPSGRSLQHGWEMVHVA